LSGSAGHDDKDATVRSNMVIPPSGATPILNGKLRGDQITFEAGGAQYAGA
jgi:hypothetical protein